MLPKIRNILARHWDIILTVSLLIAYSCLVLFKNLGNTYFPNTDDPLYASIIRNVLDGYIYPLKAGRYVFSDYNNPGFYWLAAPFSLLSSDPEISYRLFNLSCFIAFLFVFYLLAKKSFKDKFSAFLAFASIALSPFFIMEARRVMMDVPCMCLFMFYVFMVTSIKDKYVNRITPFIIFALFMIKSISISFVFFADFLFMLIVPKYRKNICMRWLCAGALMLLWFGFDFIFRLRNGYENPLATILNTVSGSRFGMNQGHLFYFDFLYRYEIAILLVITTALFHGLIHFYKKIKNKTHLDIFNTYIYLWMFGGLLLLQISTQKTPRYLLFVLPFCFLQIKGSKWITRASLTFILVFVISKFVSVHPHYKPHKDYNYYHPKLSEIILKTNKMSGANDIVHYFNTYIASALFYGKNKVLQITTNQNTYKLMQEHHFFSSQNIEALMDVPQMIDYARSEDFNYMIMRNSNYQNLGKILPLNILFQNGEYVLLGKSDAQWKISDDKWSPTANIIEKAYACIKNNQKNCVFKNIDHRAVSLLNDYGFLKYIKVFQTK